MKYYCTEGGSVVYREGGLPRNAVGVHPDGDVWVNVNLNKIDPAYYSGFGIYPATITGEGNLPTSCDWDAQTMAGSGTLIPAPAAPRHLTPFEFRSRFTTAEKAALYTAAKTDVMLEAYLDDLRVTSYVDLDLPGNAAAMAYLEGLGIIAPGRGSEILA